MAVKIWGVEVQEVPVDETWDNYELSSGDVLSRKLADRIKAAVTMWLRTDTSYTIQGLQLLYDEPESLDITDSLAVALWLDELDLRNPLVRLYLMQVFQVAHE